MKKYKDIIPEFEDFEKVIRTEPPFDIRVNQIKSNEKEIKNFLKEKNFEFNQRKWNKKIFKLKSNPSKTITHWLGKFYIQEASSTIPPMALNPSSGEKILDMCAAPGSKTTQISAMMKNEGQIVANDVKTNRLRGLLSNLYRLGCLNIQVMKRDGRNLPEKEKFDKILVDVPCSSEGNVRTQEDLLSGAPPSKFEKLLPLQEGLLNKARKMCKDGGEIVYSTCTFNPKENEMIVSKFLDKLKLTDLNFDFEHSNGITKWKGNNLSNELKKCLRVYPHQIDSGGIFIAKFKKKS